MNITKRRLQDGEDGFSVGEPKTLKEALAAAESLRDAIVALQSLDDLGSEEENNRAWNDMLELQRRYYKIKQEWKLENE